MLLVLEGVVDVYVCMYPIQTDAFSGNIHASFRLFIYIGRFS